MQQKNAGQNNGANFRETETKKGSKKCPRTAPFSCHPKSVV